MNHPGHNTQICIQPHINALVTNPNTYLITVKKRDMKLEVKEKTQIKTETENNACLVQTGHASLTSFARAIVDNGVLIAIQGINIDFHVNSIETISLH